MSSYKFDSIVNRQEAEALKELIFKRARERAESMTQESQEKYTTSIRSEIMDIARDSFASDKNPFSVKQVSSSEVQPVKEEKKVEESEIGFPLRKVEEIKSQIISRSTIKNNETAHAAVEETMAEARADFNNKKTSFMGALDFLNSQASISLVSKKGKQFEAIA